LLPSNHADNHRIEAQANGPALLLQSAAASQRLPTFGLGFHPAGHGIRVRLKERSGIVLHRPILADS